MKKILKKTINKLSTLNVDLTKHYKIYRKFNELIHCNVLNCFNNYIDESIILKKHEIKIRIFMPKQFNKKVIIYFHGGGWVIGSVNSYNKICHKISNSTGCIVVSVDYPLAPEYKFPVALDDCYEVVKYLNKQKSIIHNKFDEIILMGDSAGGNLAAVVSLMGRDSKDFKIEKQILIYPVTYYDHSENSPFLSVKENGKDWLLTNKKINDYFELYVSKKEDLKNPYVSPIISNDLSNQPKTLIITSEFDPLKDEGLAYGEKLKIFNNDVKIYCIKDTIHGFFNYSLFKKQIEETLKYINEFLE